jgi:SP family general alpha glucoside:H+ symporter-like MFS transporter
MQPTLSKETPGIMSETVESKSNGPTQEVEAEKGVNHAEHAHDLDKNAKIADYKADAVEAENMEHNMGVLEAVRAYPMAAFWAFVMSFTIVSCPLTVSTQVSTSMWKLS